MELQYILRSRIVHISYTYIIILETGRHRLTALGSGMVKRKHNPNLF